MTDGTRAYAITDDRRVPRTLHPVAWWIWAIGLAVAVNRTTNPLLLMLVLVVLGFVVVNRRTDAPSRGGLVASFLSGKGSAERAFEARIGKTTPLGRIGEPDHISKTVLFLASDDAAHVQGQELFIDGGATASPAGAPIYRG